MKNIILIGMLIIATVTAAQTAPAETKEKDNDSHIFDTNSAEKFFQTDLKNAQVKLYVMGGIVSAIKTSDLDFEKKYVIQYHDFGCLVPANLAYYQHYNQLVFDYLTEKFGTDWKKSLCKSTLGWKE